MCSELFMIPMSKHNTIWCPSELIEDGVSLRFFSVDLSRRKAVLLEGVRFGKVRMESTRTHLFLCTTLPCFFGAPVVSLVVAKMKAS